MKAVDAINDALRHIGVLARDATATGSAASDALKRLNAMLAAWENDPGIQMGVGVLELQDDLPLDDTHDETIWSNLALRLAPEYGREVSPDTREIARSGLSALAGLYATRQELQVDRGLRRRRFDRTIFR